MLPQTHHVHVDAVGVGPRVLEILLQSLSERVWDLVESDELFHAEHLHVVPRRSRIQPLDDGRNVPKNAGVHQSWRGQDRVTQMKANARYILSVEANLDQISCVCFVYYY